MSSGVSSSNSLLEKRTAYLRQIINECKVYDFFGGMSLNMKCGTEAENLRRFGSKTCDKSPDKWITACEKRNIVALKVSIRPMVVK